MNTNLSDSVIPADLLAWKKISTLFETGELRDKLKGFSKETLEFAANEANVEKMVDSILAYLKVNEPEKANVEYASKVVDIMRRIANNLLSEA